MYISLLWNPEKFTILLALVSSNLMCDDWCCDFQDARQRFRSVLVEATLKLDELLKKIGKAVEDSKPYWEARRVARQVRMLSISFAQNTSLPKCLFLYRLVSFMSLWAAFSSIICYNLLSCIYLYYFLPLLFSIMWQKRAFSFSKSNDLQTRNRL